MSSSHIRALTIAIVSASAMECACATALSGDDTLGRGGTSRDRATYVGRRVHLKWRRHVVHEE